MKKGILLATLLFTMLIQAQQSVNIIPQPLSINLKKGSFVIDEKTSIEASKSDKEAQKVALFFESFLNKVSKVPVKNNISKSTKKISFLIERNAELGEEGYTINVTSDAIAVKANTSKGLFYGMQSLVQTLPLTKGNDLVQIPALEIKDYPRFKWRGVMLDVCRYFFTIDMMKEYIDLMATYKMNVLHWHLTEDQGWRIEIKKYPRLTEIGSVRNGTIIGRFPGKGNTNTPVTGFYTQEQVKELVKYASDRAITIIPEIEMPGHSSAAIAAYPELSCFPKERTKFRDTIFSLQSRKELAEGRLKFVQETWGVFEDVYAPTEYTFKFLEDVIDEIVPLFPSKYIHIAGDECPKESWKRSEFCQNLIKEKGLKDEHGLQSYFITRMEKYINSKGKSIIGWDEILEGGLAPNATVMSWRGEKGGIEAAKLNHDVIMTPGDPCYLNRPQGDPEVEPVGGWGVSTLKNVYSYEPIPSELNAEQAKHVLGSQANFWTEYIPTFEHLQYMALPRLLALSEVMWSPKEKRNWKDFRQRLNPQFKSFESKGLKYSKGDFRALIKTETINNVLSIVLETENPDAVMYYTIDGTVPTTSSPKYEKPIVIDKSLTIKAITVLDGQVMTKKPAEQSFAHNKALGKKISYEHKYSSYYKAQGDNSLIDGIKGTKDITKNWHGFQTNDVVATVDLGDGVSVNNIALGCIQNWSKWIFLPKWVKFEISTDGVNFKEIQTITNTVAPTEKGDIFKTFKVEIPQQIIKKVRVTAKNLGDTPIGHPEEKQEPWVFVDEIMIN
ncbi:glycoside hydrolase family 20 protein [Flavobacterium mesophilum]|uniref:glycoside hydrolase family 20 protein n=1 Tax=Flavobacterium mesophilum TaxID=3143495 RepID=UPI0031D4E3FE